MPPLFDSYWNRFWSACEERNLAVIVHAGFGTEQGAVFPEVERIYNDVVKAANSTDVDELFAHAGAVSDESLEFFSDFLNRSVDARRPMWQLMLGGVFDRFPGLRYMPTEIRLDWIPATLAYLDRFYEEHREDLPATRKPSEYWQSNCMAGASFIHKAEVEMRHEIGDRDDAVRSGLSASRKHVAQYPRLVEGRFRRSARGRAAADPGRERHPIPESGPGPFGRDCPTHRTDGR